MKTSEHCKNHFFIKPEMKMTRWFTPPQAYVYDDLLSDKYKRSYIKKVLFTEKEN